MLHRLSNARLLWPSLLALIGLGVLLGLGTWQLKRKAWKESIIAKIETRVDAPPVDLVNLLTATHEDSDLEYTHVKIRGRYLNDKERYLYAPERSGLGWHVLTPLLISPETVVWINRGFVPDARKDPATRKEGEVEGEVTVTGLLRQPHTAAFTPANDVARNIWHWADTAGLTASAFPGQPMKPLRVVIDADASETPAGGLPKGGVTRLQIPNRHLEYAFTWYGLAATLVGVFVAFAVGRLREPKIEKA
ncbi:MAG: SURF1 family protein [Hyphomicrobiales bacterium]|nr:MAG: SURF1 family protein [Hyphomicrobiales bacterium]